jgi:exopolysaccharide biosynthesis predicted pyruvyltransferase EpsI
MLQIAPVEVVKHILSYIHCGQTKFRLYRAAKSLRKYLLPKKKLITHRLQGHVLSMFMGCNVIFDSPVAVGISRLWSFMDKFEQERLKDWIQRHKEHQGTSISLYEDGMYFTSNYRYYSIPVPKLFAPYPREIFWRA